MSAREKKRDDVESKVPEYCPFEGVDSVPRLDKVKDQSFLQLYFFPIEYFSLAKGSA